MTPDVWADFNQVDGEGHVVAYLEDVVHAERVVVGNVVVVADPEAAPHTAVVVTMSPSGTFALDVDWASRPTAAATGSTARI